MNYKSPVSKLIIFFSLFFTLCAGAQCTYFTTIVSGAGSRHSLGIKNDGTLWAWGNNLNGQLGDGTTINRLMPTLIDAGTNWVSVSAGTNHSLGITSDGKAWAWGRNFDGQLGDNTTTNRLVPTEVGLATNWLSISAGHNHSLGITSDGKAWAWGYNNSGQLGNNSYDNRHLPTQIGTDNNWIKITGGADHSLGITSDGKAWGWGNNGDGQLGDNTTEDKLVPTQIGLSTKWISLSGGGYHSLGITSDGKAWSWGWNYYGQLGDNSNVPKLVPTQVGIATNWVNICAGNNHSIGTTSDGKTWSWGRNIFGQLGDGTTISRLIPTQIGISNNWVSISVGADHNFAISADGKTFAWGRNFFGQLGDNTTTNGDLPGLIGTIPDFTSLAANASNSTKQQGQYTLFDNSCSIIAALGSTRASLIPIRGNITAKVWVESIPMSQYVKRHYQITPITNTGNLYGRLTLYFSQSEFDDYNAANSIDLPSGSEDGIGKANLRIEKREGSSSDGTGLPDTYSGAISYINPSDTDIVWNSIDSRWEVSFDVTGFSGFFIKSVAAVPLPVTLLSFNGKGTEKGSELNWQIVNKKNFSHFEIERSFDSKIFEKIGDVKINNGETYAFLDNNTQNADPKKLNFYRLKMIDFNGAFSFSKIIYIENIQKRNIIIIPNPVESDFEISGINLAETQYINIYNLTGSLLSKKFLSNQKITIANFNPGIYIIEIEHINGQKRIAKIVKN